MSKFIVGTFLILGWTFYVLSGGADFVPEERVVAEAEPTPEETVEIAVVEAPRSEILELADATSAPDTAPEPIAEIQVTRAETSQLLDLSTAELTQPIVDTDEVAVSTALVEDEPDVEAVLASIIEDVAEESPLTTLDIRLVAGSRVNMRSGPGTNYAVLDTLDGGTAAEVLEVDASGWARIRLQDSGQIGWMAERLLSES